jgi:DNA-binding ferritin-like protein
MEDNERLRVVLKHLIEHNEGHAEDYKRWIELAKNAGMNTVADLIREANDHVEKASVVLKKALDLID